MYWCTRLNLVLVHNFCIIKTDLLDLGLDRICFVVFVYIYLINNSN